MVRIWIVVVAIGLAAAACSAEPRAPESSASPSSNTQTSTSTDVQSSTSSPTTVTSPPPEITLAGSPLLYATGGPVTIEGWIDRPAVVTVEGEAAETSTTPGGRTTFSLEFDAPPGDHELEIVAAGTNGLRASRTIELIVDPSLVRELAYISELDISANTLVADYVQWLTGDAAVAAAREDGAIGPDEDLPNGDYYIRNQNPKLRTLELSDAPVIILQACYPDDGPCVVGQPVDVGVWSQLLGDPESAAELTGWEWTVSFGLLPCWLTLDDGIVVQVEEQYLP